MSASNDPPRDPAAEAVLSTDLADLLAPGVVVELDAGEAESLGAFVETALTETDAWAANADLATDEADDGD
jgi:hypothetical protein